MDIIEIAKEFAVTQQVEELDAKYYTFTQEDLQAFAHRIEQPLQQQVEQLREALQALYDEQNGPPLIRDAARWEAAMQLSSKALEKTK